LLEVADLHVSYGRIAAVRGVSFSVSIGEMICLVGPNGAGKSTTMMTVAGALKPIRGTIGLQGASIVGKAPEDIARLGISFVPEGRRVFARLTVEENVLIGSDMRKDRKKVQADFERVMSYFPVLRERFSAPAGKLSGGEQQQLAIARALMTDPRVMLIDEPSLGLAPLIVDRVYEIMRSLVKDGKTLVVVEQSTHRALENADRLYVIRNGEIMLHGSARDLADEDIERAYFGFEADRPAIKSGSGGASKSPAARF
jgi:branched-chain amino acid transport system ATP-binding protein